MLFSLPQNIKTNKHDAFAINEDIEKQFFYESGGFSLSHLLTDKA